MTALAAACAFGLACGGGDSSVPSGWTGYEGEGYRAATAPGWELLRLGGGEVATLVQLGRELRGIEDAVPELRRAMDASANRPIEVVVMGDRAAAPPYIVVPRPCAGSGGTREPTGMPGGWTEAGTVTVDGVAARRWSREMAGVVQHIVWREAGGCVDAVLLVTARPERVAEFERFLGTMRFER